MVLSVRFDEDERKFVVCLVHMDAQFRKKLFRILQQNFSIKNILEWEGLADLDKDFPQTKWMLWFLDWSLYILKGLKGEPTVCEEFSDVFGDYLMIEMKIPIMSSLSTWVRSLKKKGG